MPAVAEPVRGFALSDFDGPGQPADNPTIDQSTGKIIDPPPAPERTAPEPEPAPEPEKAEPEAPERPENEPTDKKPEDEDESPTSINDALDEQERAGSDEAKAKAAADKKAAEEAAVEKAKAEAAKPAEAKERDADLKPELGPHVRPSTRKIITEMQAKASAARDKEEAAIARAEAAEAKARELEEKVKTAPPPTELVEENKRLLERVRELDITKDPVLEQKYDRKIEANNKSIVDVLKGQAYDTIQIKKEDGSVETKPAPERLNELVKSGLTMRNLAPLIKKLEEVGALEDAEALREALRDNHRLSKERQAEIETWKGDYTKRQQTREQETKQQTEKRQAEYRQQTDLQLNAEIDDLAKNFSFVKRPAAPLPTDTPATAQAKNAQIAEYDASAKQIEAAVAGLKLDGAPPEKFAQIVGRINALATAALVHKIQVFPRMLKDLQAREARIKELEGRIGKMENAGKLSRTQSASTEERNAQAGRPEATSLDDAFGAGPQ